MGLDMYFNRRIYVGGMYDFNKVKGEIKLTKGNMDEPIKVDLKKVSYIVEEVGYWRKDNHIHNWFVTNNQNGNDDCGDYYVSKENLEELLGVCKQVLENHELAEQLLPTQSGFFFGSTEYNEYYFKSVEYTVKLIEEIFEEDPEFKNEYYYTSSW